MAKLEERNGVRLGQPVRDVDGKDLGRVTTLYDEGFEVARGFPILFRSSWVVRYDEARSASDGVLVVARSDRDLLTLARGGVPPSWRVPAPEGFPDVATPPEGREVIEAIAAARAAHGPPPALPAEGEAALAASRGVPLGAGAGDPSLSPAEEAAYVESHGQTLEEAPRPGRAPPGEVPAQHIH